MNIYVGAIPEDVALPGDFCTVAGAVKHQTGALAIGVRDPASGSDTINPPDDLQVGRQHELIYLAESAILSETDRQDQ